MKIIGVIPARYASSRLPGKPLADICGKPMIWWVYQQANKTKGLSQICVATDNHKIVDVCKKYKMPVIMTSDSCPNHIHRIYEVSLSISADYYISINGDEPLIDPQHIESVLPKTPVYGKPFFQSVYRDISNPAEVIDISNVKIVLDQENRCMYQSRLPIPSTKGSIDFSYKKAIGIECFNAEALAFFANAPMGVLERIEDIDHLRFLENGMPIYYRRVDSQSISVDTSADLERVREILSKNHR